MTAPTPADIALLAYDQALNTQLRNPPGLVLGNRSRQLLQANPAIKAMLAAHERAVLLAAGQKLRDYAEDGTPVDATDAQRAKRRHLIRAARLIEPEPTDDEIRAGVADLIADMADLREPTALRPPAPTTEGTTR